MFPKNPEILVSIPSRTDLLKMIVELTNHISILNNFDSNMSHKISLAVDEAITNVIKHSYKSKEDHEIIVEYYPDKKGLLIKIRFSGIPPKLRKSQVNIRNLIKEKKKGGLGVELIKKIMDSVEYKVENNQNCCEMIKWKK